MNRTVDIEESIVGILYSHPKSFAEVIKIAPLIKNSEMRQAIEIAKHAQKEYGQFDPRYTIDRVSEAGENPAKLITNKTTLGAAGVKIDTPCGQNDSTHSSTVNVTLADRVSILRAIHTFPEGPAF